MREQAGSDARPEAVAHGDTKKHQLARIHSAACVPTSEPMYRRCGLPYSAAARSRWDSIGETKAGCVWCPSLPVLAAARCAEGGRPGEESGWRLLLLWPDAVEGRAECRTQGWTPSLGGEGGASS